MKRTAKFYLSVIIALIMVIGFALPASADEQLCVDVVADDAAGIQTIDTNDLYGQSFTPSDGFVLDAVKFSWWGFGESTTANVYIVNTSFTGGAFRPDMTSVLATETLDLSALPLLDFTPPNDNPYSCNPTILPEQYLEFDPQVALVSGTTYAIVIEYAAGSTAGDVVASPYTVPAPGSAEYALGLPWDCEVSGACTRNTPSTWDLPNSCNNCSFSFTLFDNITTTSEVNIDSWTTNFLASMGMNSPFGRIVVGSGFAMFFFLILAKWGVPWILSLGITGLFTAFLTAVSIFDPTILLGMIAIVGIGAMALIFSLFMGGDKGNG